MSTPSPTDILVDALKAHYHTFTLEDLGFELELAVAKREATEDKAAARSEFIITARRLQVEAATRYARFTGGAFLVLMRGALR